MRPHELFFTMLLTTLIARLPWREGSLITLLLLFHLWLSLSRETPLKIWGKRIAQVLYVPLLYFTFKILIPLLGSAPKDLFLQKIDAFLVGESLSVQARSIAHPLLTEIMYVCYLLFFAYIILSLWRHRSKESFFTGLFTIYWIGFLGYTCLPAEGPYLAIPELSQSPLREGLYWSAPIYDFLLASTNRADVFPSLHCALSGFCLCFDWLHQRERFYRFLPLAIAIWVSTIYLGYHYLIDLIAASLLLCFALRLIKRKNQVASFWM